MILQEFNLLNYSTKLHDYTSLWIEKNLQNKKSDTAYY